MSTPADDVSEALVEEDQYEPEKTCVLCLRDDVYEEGQPFDNNGVWRHLPGGAVICDRCGMAAADAAKVAKGEVRPRGQATDDVREALTLIARDVHLYDGGANAAITGLHAQRIADAVRARFEIRPRGPVTDAEVEGGARAAAILGDYDGCFLRIDEWEALEEWEREAHPENCPHDDYEDAEFWRTRTRAALEAAKRANS